MTTNDLKSGDKVTLKCGWEAVMADNKRGNIRMAKVFGNYTELGSIYMHDVAYHTNANGFRVAIELTPAQAKQMKMIKAAGF
jgi:hypothetical protein